MRIMDYRVLMSDNIGADEGYVISNEILCSDPSREGDMHNSGIKMTVEKCNDLELLLRCFTYVITGDEENPHFSQCYKQALYDENTSWKLTAVRLDHRFMWMIFQNRELYDRYYDDTESSNRPYYQECVCFEMLGDKKIQAQLKFEIEHAGSSEPETTIVSFSYCGPTVITEVYKSRKRSLFLPGQAIILDNEKYQQLVHITECYC